MEGKANAPLFTGQIGLELPGKHTKSTARRRDMVYRWLMRYLHSRTFDQALLKGINYGVGRVKDEVRNAGTT
jgi:hypothetical protein